MNFLLCKVGRQALGQVEAQGNAGWSSLLMSGLPQWGQPATCDITRQKSEGMFSVWIRGQPAAWYLESSMFPVLLVRRQQVEGTQARDGIVVPYCFQGWKPLLLFLPILSLHHLLHSVKVMPGFEQARELSAFSYQVLCLMYFNTMYDVWRTWLQRRDSEERERQALSCCPLIRGLTS